MRSSGFEREGEGFVVEARQEYSVGLARRHAVHLRSTSSHELRNVSWRRGVRGRRVFGCRVTVHDGTGDSQSVANEPHRTIRGQSEWPE